MNQQQEDFEIDLREIFFVLKKNMLLILSITILFGVLAGMYSKYHITPKYASRAKIYVIAKTDTVLSFSDLNLSTGLTSDYMELIESRPVLQQVIDDLDLSMGYAALKSCVSLTNPADTRILYITVTCEDAVMARDIANQIVSVATKRISNIMDIDEPSVVEDAIVNTTVVSPNIKRNAVMAAMMGFVLISGIIVLISILDDRVKNSDDIERYLGLATLGLIPDDLDGVKGGNKRTKILRRTKNKRVKK